MTVEIPVWLIWTLGIVIGVPLTIFVLGCAVIGFMFVSAGSGIWR